VRESFHKTRWIFLYFKTTPKARAKQTHARLAQCPSCLATRELELGAGPIGRLGTAWTRPHWIRPACVQVCVCLCVEIKPQSGRAGRSERPPPPRETNALDFHQNQEGGSRRPKFFAAPLPLHFVLGPLAALDPRKPSGSPPAEQVAESEVGSSSSVIVAVVVVRYSRRRCRCLAS
jgi:hypothetical protein